MTRITIISTFTTIVPDGQVQLRDCSLQTQTIAAVQREIAHRTGVPEDRQSLWWHGYLLDRKDQTIQEACVGVTPEEEAVDPHAETLVLFLTVPIEKTKKNRTEPTTTTTANSSRSRYRSTSLDHSKRDAVFRDSRTNDSASASCVLM